MRRLSSIPRASTPSRQPTVCLFCQHRSAASRPTTTTTAAFSTTRTTLARSRPAAPASQPDFLERTRRRIWGTDTPPGAADPYARTPAKTSSDSTTASAAASELEEGDLDVDSAAKVRAYAEAEYKEAKAKEQQAVEDALMHQDYVPATSWEGLEMVGGEVEWDRGRVFEGFLAANRITDPQQITAVIYRSTVEVFAALSASRPPRISKNYEVGSLLSAASRATVNYSSETGDVSITYPDGETERAVLRAGSPSVIPGADELEAVLDEEVLGAKVVEAESHAELKAAIAGWGKEWRSIPLEDQKVKFYLIKRLTRLLGRTIPDSITSKSHTVNDLVVQLAVPPPKKSLFEVLQSQKVGLQELPNVTVQGRRRTPIDKEKELGRWKVIEKELRDRDLPVVGRG